LSPKSPNQSCQFCGLKWETLHHLGFEAQPRNRPPVLRPSREKLSPTGLRPKWRKPSQTINLGFKAQPRNPCSLLHVHGVDCTRCHPTSRPPGHRVSDLCDYSRSSAPGLLLLPRSSSLHAMPQLPPAHHETNKRDSPSKIKIKEKQNKIIPNLNSNLAKSLTHHTQTNEWTTWFLMT
jgi:hypothetical protein